MQVQVTEPQTRQVTHTLETLGTFQRYEDVIVKAEVGGRVRKIYFDEERYFLKVNRAEVALHQAKKGLKYAESALRRADLDDFYFHRLGDVADRDGPWGRRGTAHPHGNRDYRRCPHLNPINPGGDPGFLHFLGRLDAMDPAGGSPAAGNLIRTLSAPVLTS